MTAQAEATPEPWLKTNILEESEARDHKKKKDE
jgi:hypothetical protein